MTSASAATTSSVVARINAGGGAYTDAAGNAWSADKYYTGGWTYSTTHAIAGTTNQTLYKSERAGMSGYAIPVPAAGTYHVTLHFAELYWSSAGSRVFGVKAEGTQVVSNLDIYAAAGANTALTRSVDVPVSDGTLNLGFTASADQPKVSGIEVTTGSTATPSPTTSPTSSPTASPTAPAPTTSPAPSAGKLLIHYGWDMPTPSEVSARAALIDSRPFDGIVVHLGSLTGISGTPHSVSEYANALAPMPALKNVKHNFVCLRFLQSTYDAYDDAYWATAAQNYANLAAAMRANGKFDGIFIDTEFYGSGQSLWDYGTSTTPWTYSATAGATPGHQPADARAKVSARGQQIASGILSSWPNATIFTTHGAYVSDDATANVGYASLRSYNNVAWANELLGSFDVGLAQGVANIPTGTYVDGGEVYVARSLADFQTVHDWNKTGLAKSGTVLIPSSFASTYSSVVNASVGVYDYDVNTAGWPILSASTWQTLLTNAYRTADKYVWAYSEAYDWMGGGWPSTPVPQAYLDATAAARASQ